MASRRARNLTAGYRWDMAARIFLAFFGGFLWISTLGALAATVADRAGWMPLAQGVHVMTLAGYLLWCAAAMWVFYQRRLQLVAVLMTASGLAFFALQRVI